MYRKIGKALLFPPLWVRILLIPLSVALLVPALVFLASDAPLAIAAYVLAAYTLTVWCVKLPTIVRLFKTLRTENPLIRRWLGDARLRTNVTLGGALFFNAVYALFHFALGIYYRTFWFSSMGGYYAVLALLRFFLFRYAKEQSAGKDGRGALVRYRATGVVFLLLALALALVLFFMIYFRRTFFRGQIVTIALAAYTFLSLTFAILAVVRHKGEGGPVASGIRATALAAASVSLLTLTSTMLTTFGGETMTEEAVRLFVGLTGAAVLLFITLMALYMIVDGTKKLTLLRKENTNHD